MENDKEDQPMRLFVKSGCPWCVDAVRYLRAEGYVFQEIDVLRDSAAFDEMIALSGQSLAPTLDVAGSVLPDFDVGQLKEFLAANRITPEMTQ
ncbi:MAG: glutaredoxin family protein [Verrucomicrobiae bacterium]|nr:glutaredoxin family protein [Verrucomicrobiae bacterium]